MRACVLKDTLHSWRMWQYETRAWEIQPLMWLHALKPFWTCCWGFACFTHETFLFLLKSRTSDVGNTQVADYWNIQIIGCQIKGILVHLYSLW